MASCGLQVQDDEMAWWCREVAAKVKGDFGRGRSVWNEVGEGGTT